MSYVGYLEGRNSQTFQGFKISRLTVKSNFLRLLYAWMASLSSHSFTSLIEG